MRVDAQRNRNLIIASAQDLFAEAGVDVPVDEIAKRAGVGTGTFYRHFPTKEALIRAVLIDKARRLLDIATQAVRAKASGEALFDVLSDLVSHGGRKKDLVATLAGPANIFGEDDANITTDLWHAIGVLLTNAQTAGHVRTDIDLLALKALLSGVCVSLDQANGNESLERRIWSVFKDGLRSV